MQGGLHVEVAVVDVRRVSLTPAQFAYLVDQIWEEDAKARILRYHKGCASASVFPRHAHEDTKCFLIGRLMLQASAARAFASPAPSRPLGADPLLKEQCHRLFRRTAQGKPHFDNSEYWNASVSHAGPAVALSVSRGMLTGVDVMPVEIVPRPRRLDGLSSCDSEFWRTTLNVDDVEEFLTCFDSYFTAREWEWIRGVAGTTPFDTLKRFFVNWTLKESYIKAIGIGLGLELQRAEFVVTSHLSDTDFTVTEGSALEPQRASISLFLDHVLQPSWTFALFEFGRANTVGAVAIGPLSDAVAPLFPVHMCHDRLCSSTQSASANVTPLRVLLREIRPLDVCSDWVAFGLVSEQTSGEAGGVPFCV